jgi:hypothetical protein
MEKINELKSKIADTNSRITVMNAKLELMQDVKHNLTDYKYSLEKELIKEYEKYYWSKVQKGGFYKWINKDVFEESVFVKILGVTNNHLKVDVIHKLKEKEILHIYEHIFDQYLDSIQLHTKCNGITVDDLKESSESEFRYNTADNNTGVFFI